MEDDLHSDIEKSWGTWGQVRQCSLLLFRAWELEQKSVSFPQMGEADPGLLLLADALLSQGDLRTTCTRSRAGLGCFSTSWTSTGNKIMALIHSPVACSWDKADFDVAQCCCLSYSFALKIHRNTYWLNMREYVLVVQGFWLRVYSQRECSKIDFFNVNLNIMVELEVVISKSEIHCWWSS